MKKWHFSPLDKWLLLVSCFLFIAPVFSYGENLGLMRRWVVFPYETDASLKSAAEDAWWKFREKLTLDRKYLVASRQFLVQKEAFQPRKELSPDDVKLLGQLLEADVIVTGYSEHRQFTINVYLAQNGKLFWSKRFSFHPSLREADQLEVASEKMSQDLLDQIPYQAFTVTDPLIGKPVYEETNKKYAVVDVGNTENLSVGSEIQWVDVVLPENAGPGPLIEQTKIAVIAEGKIVTVRRGVVVAEVQKATADDKIIEKSLVRIPSEVKKMEVAMGLTDDLAPLPHQHLAPEMIPTVVSPVTPDSAGARKKTLLFGSIFSILGIIALGL